MVDFHSHILPKMDDGSSSVAESIEMLKALSKQGIDKVVATPHFYANDESVTEFIKRRAISFENLKNSVTDEMPRVLLGAEVKYYEGISRLKGLHNLCVQNTELLLLEMPMKRWTEYVLKELSEISCSGKITVVLAHVERYMRFQRSGVIEQLLKNGIQFQINANFVCDFLSRRKAIGLFKSQAVHFLGSDCHNMSDRQPDIGKAYETVEKRLGVDFADAFKGYAENLLK